MMKFQTPDYKFVSEEEFWNKIKEFCNNPKLNAKNKTLEEAKESLVACGSVSFLKQDKPKSWPTWNNFFMADEEVFDMIPIIEESEYDPLDNDSFNIAFEIYKAGWRKDNNV